MAKKPKYVFGKRADEAAKALIAHEVNYPGILKLFIDNPTKATKLCAEWRKEHRRLQCQLDFAIDKDTEEKDDTKTE